MPINIMPVQEHACSLVFKGNTLEIKGNIDFYQPGKIIGPFINQLHSEIIREKVTQINIDIKELVFLNSSGIKEFVIWIMKIMSLKKDEQYRLNFVCSKQIAWQADSLNSLKLINKELVDFIYE